MPAERYFIENSFEVNTPCILQDQEFHHLIHVMRNKIGDTIEIVNGLGELAQGFIQDITKKQASIIIKHIRKDSPSPSQLILAQALPRPNRLDFILEKGTELGMTELWLFPGKQGERKDLTDHQLERMKNVTVAAMKQCGRLFLPKIIIKSSLEKWSTFPKTSFFGDVSPDSPNFLDVFPAYKQETEIAFFIGPESGFSESELLLLKKHALGVKLNPNILRTDTAALCCLSLMNAYK